MSDAVILSLSAAEALAAAALIANRTSPDNAAATARALVAAEADGQSGHGLSRVPSYALHARVGKVAGFARPSVQQVAGAVLRIDAAHGFAYPAINLAIDSLPAITRTTGIALAAITRSHHFGQAGAHVERLAQAGLAALMLGNTPKAMAMPGGKLPLLGTNPIAFAAPLSRANHAPLVIDLALSIAARGKIVAARKNSESIPSDWANDPQGQPTTDPGAALAGTLAPIGGAKGAALALMVEVIAAALTGSAFGWEASSMFDDRGGPPNVGQILIAFDPQRIAGGALDDRMGALLDALSQEPEVRLPGERRLAARARAASEGLKIAPRLHAEITALAQSMRRDGNSSHG